MAVNGQQGIGLLLKAEDQISGPAGKAGDAMVGLSGRISSSAELIDRALRAAAGGVMIFNAGFKMLKGAFGLAVEAGKFTQEMAAVKAITASSTEEMKKMGKAALEAGLQTQFSPKEGAEALRSLAQAGMKGQEAIDALVPSLDLAAASLGKLSPARATGVVNAGLKAFAEQGQTATKVVDAMVFATNSFNISVHQLPVGIGNLSRGAIALKQGMDDSFIALGLVKNVLPEISSAATLTSSAMLRVADPTIQKKLKKLGVQFRDSKGDFLPIISIFQNLDTVLKGKFTKSTDQAGAAVKILGKRGILPFTVIMKQLNSGISSLPAGFNKGNIAFQVMRLQFKAAKGDMQAVEKLARMGLPKAFVEAARKTAKAGAAKLFVQTLLGTFTGQLTLLDGAFKSFKTVLGVPLSEVFKPFVSAMFHAFGFLSRFIADMNPTVKRLAATFAIVTIAVVTLTGAVIALKAAIKFLGPSVKTAVAPFLPIIGIALAIAAAIVVMRAAWETNFMGIRDIVAATWSGIKEGFIAVVGPIWNELKGTFTELMKTFGDLFQALKIVMVDLGLISNKTATDMTSGWRIFGQFIGVVLGGAVRVILTVVKGLSMMVKLLGAVGSAIGSKFAGGKFEFVMPKEINDAVTNGLFTTKDNAVINSTKNAGMQSNITTGRVTPLPSALAREPGFWQWPSMAASQTPTQATAPAQNQTVQLKGDINIEGSKIGQFVLDNKNDNRNAGGIRTRSR